VRLHQRVGGLETGNLELGKKMDLILERLSGGVPSTEVPSVPAPAVDFSMFELIVRNMQDGLKQHLEVLFGSLKSHVVGIDLILDRLPREAAPSTDVNVVDKLALIVRDELRQQLEGLRADLGKQQKVEQKTKHLKEEVKKLKKEMQQKVDTNKVEQKTKHLKDEVQKMKKEMQQKATASTPASTASPTNPVTESAKSPNPTSPRASPASPHA